MVPADKIQKVYKQQNIKLEYYIQDVKNVGLQITTFVSCHILKVAVHLFLSRHKWMMALLNADMLSTMIK